MGSICKIGDTYYIEFYARGLMYSKIAGSSLEEAERLLQKTEAVIASGEALTIERQIDLAVFLSQFIEIAGKEFVPKTVKRFLNLSTHFQDFINKNYPSCTKLSQITPSILESYKKYLQSEVEDRVVNLSLLLLSEILEYGIRIGFMNDNPVIHVRLLPWKKNHIRETARYLKVKELTEQKVGFAKIARLLHIGDIARLLYYRNLIPTSREDMYN